MRFVLSLLMLVFSLCAFAQTDTLQPQTAFPSLTENVDTLINQAPGKGMDLPRAFVYSVYDGDGCRVRLEDGSIRKIRFAGCDSPEFANSYTTTTQPYAKQSRDSLRQLILGKVVYLDTLPMGKVKYTYGRLVANIFTTDTMPIWVNHYIVTNGWAWNVTQTNAAWVEAGFPEMMAEAQDDAKNNKRGLWGLKGKKYTPAYWRKTYKREAGTP